jgi:hypothetical protein
MYICVNICICMYRYIYIHICIDRQIDICIYIYIYICIELYSEVRECQGDLTGIFNGFKLVFVYA